MSSENRFRANRANAQHSTGPRTPEGKAKSASNSTRHGLQCQPSTLFSQSPEQQSHFNSLREELFAQCLPHGAMELEAFERYAFSLFQSRRARSLEIDALDRYTNEPNNDSLLRALDRLFQMATQLERRADRALAELRKLQQDRFHSAELQNEMFVTFKQQIEIPASLPLTAMRREQSPIQIATQALSLKPAIQAAFTALTKITREQVRSVDDYLAPIGKKSS